MMMNHHKESKDHHAQPKQEGENMSRVSSSFASGPWFKSKDPRIVRVSRTFGGKDRHSKVCTVRGLRDRRVRLSVPTAIQLYDLQDRLGLSQPSKVVDWLLEAAKEEIDELPPLPFIHPVNFGQPMFIDQSGGSNRFDVPNPSQVKDNDDEEQDNEGSEDTNNNNNPFLFPYGSHYQYSEPSVQAGDESHGFVSIAHHHHQLPSLPGLLPRITMVETSPIESTNHSSPPDGYVPFHESPVQQCSNLNCSRKRQEHRNRTFLSMFNSMDGGARPQSASRLLSFDLKPKRFPRKPKSCYALSLKNLLAQIERNSFPNYGYDPHGLHRGILRV